MVILLAAQQLTCAFKLLCRRSEQQFSLHAVWAGAACDAGLFVAGLHPVGKPTQAAVAVQRVSADGPDGTRKQMHSVKSELLCHIGNVPHLNKFTTKVMKLEILFFFPHIC